MIRSNFALVLLVWTGAASAQQAPDTPPRFDVASVTQQPSDDCSKKGSAAPKPTPGKFIDRCITLGSYIQSAYVWFAEGKPGAVRMFPMSGEPAWFTSGLFEIDARAAGNPMQGMMPGPMLQTLLEEHFNLKLHKETKEAPVYLLTAAKNGRN